MNFINLLCGLTLCIVIANCQKIGYGTPSSISKSQDGGAIDEVVVESSLYIKKKPQIRRVRDLSSLVSSGTSNYRIKRQHRGQQFGSSQSAANAAAYNNFYNSKGFGASAANAQAQGFQSKSPTGSFGATAANTQTQNFAAGANGITGAAGASISQTYDFPGKHIGVNFSNGFSAGPGGISSSNSGGVTYS